MLSQPINDQGRRKKKRFPIQIRYEFQAVWRWMAQLKTIDDYFDRLPETKCKMIGPTKYRKNKTEID